MKFRTLLSFIYSLIFQNIKIWHNQQKIKIDFPESFELPFEVLKFIQKYKDEILKLLKENNLNSSDYSPYKILKADEEHPPLSYAQQRLWFLDQLFPNQSVYNIPMVFRVEYTFDVEAFTRAVTYIVHRHESLRTRIGMHEEEGYQVILDTDAFTVGFEDISSLSGEEKAKTIQEIVDSEAGYRFKLDGEWLFRVRVMREDADHHVVCMILHHIISDGWSNEILFRELNEAYVAYQEGKEPNLIPLGIQYADYAIWQREWLKGERLEAQLSYWKKMLSGALESIDLPTDYERPKELTYRGGVYTTEIDVKTLKALKVLGESEGATLFMTLLAAINVVLYKHSGQKDIVIGTPIANRNHHEIEGLIGFFVNTLALRTKIDPQESFRGLLRRVKEWTLEAYEHQDVPFEQVVDHLDIPRQLNRNPVFQVMFVLQNMGLGDQGKTGDLEGGDGTPHPQGKIQIPEWLRAQEQMAKFDLSIEAYESVDKLHLSLNYLKDVFKQESIIRIASHLKTLIGEIVEAPEKATGSYKVLDWAEKEKLLIEWNATEREYPRDKTVVELFEEQVFKNPNNVAVVYGEESLTYKELNERSNQMAHYLRCLGVRAETLVGVSLDRSLELIIGILGILKAGGAYVPLDPEYPEERLQFMLEDTAAPVLITSIHLKGKYTSYKGSFVIIDDEKTEEELGQESKENLEKIINGDNLVYVIYTSGSTGQPKGVMIEHKALYNRLIWMKKAYNIESSKDRILHKTSIGFDVSVWELLLPLIAGVIEVIAQPDIHKDPQLLQEDIHKYDISILHMVPSFLDSLLEVYDSYKLKSLRKVFASGEALSKAVVSKLYGMHKKSNHFMELHNLYGPTEATIDVTYWECNNYVKYLSIPIGCPISNTKIYILDENRCLVPVGAVGEIYIGGIGLARGYLNRPELTAERFIGNPFANEEDITKGENLRLYRTGDLGRYLSDGNIEFRGRIDDQVKIRGYRIELGEIESALNGCGVVQGSVVVARSMGVGADNRVGSDKRLIGYIVPSSTLRGKLVTQESFKSSTGEEIGILGGEGYIDIVREVKEEIGKRLPEYMVPAHIVFIEKLPLTSNGKVDKKGLPDPDVEMGLVHQYMGPRDEVEAKLCKIWAEVLGLERVGIHDNFFEIGGDSILSIRIVSKARNKGLKLNVKDIFQYLTVSGIRLVITDAAVENDMPINQRIVTGDVSLIPIQRWFFEQNHVNPNHSNQAFIMNCRYQLELDKLENALKSLLSHHDALRLRFILKDGVWTQTLISPEECIEYVQGICRYIDVQGMSELTRKSQEEIIEEIGQEVQSCLNITAGPMIQVRLLGCQGGQQKILLVIHHLSVDGVSWRIFFEDLEIAYAQVSRGEAVTLSYKTHSYQKWAEGLKAYATREEVKAEVKYWSQIGHIPALPRPKTEFELENKDKDQNYTQNRYTYEGVDSVEVELDHEMTRMLLQEVHQAYHTQINDVLLTALALTISEWTGEDNVYLDLEGHGREEIVGLDVSRTIGWFTTVFPIKLKIEGGGYREYIKTIKEQLRQIPNKGIGYGVLRYLGSEDIQSQLACTTPEIVFNYLGQWNSSEQTNGMFTFGDESIGSSVDLKNTRAHILEINSHVTHGQFRVVFGYSGNVYSGSVIKQLATCYIDHLKGIIEHCRGVEILEYTPSDMPLAHLSQSELDYCIKLLPKNIERIYRLSPMQEGLLFTALYRDSDEYLVQGLYELTGEIDTQILKEAWEAVVSHHPVLRTGFVYEHVSHPVQYVVKDVVLPWVEEDWSDLSETEQELRLGEVIQEDRRHRFDLTQVPLIRLRVMRCRKNKIYLLWTQDHLLMDGWCGPILHNQVMVAYEHIQKNSMVTLPYSRPYEEYIRWLETQDLEKAKEFWKGYLKGIEEKTQLDLGGSSVRDKGTFQETLNLVGEDYGYFETQLSVEDSEQLKRFAQSVGITVNTVLQGVWAFVLSRYVQQQDVVFGVTVSGRSIELSGIEEIVGLFINTLPLRVTLNLDLSIRKYLQSIQENMSSIIEHGYVSLADIQGQTELRGRHELFNTLIVFENYPVGEESANVGFEFKGVRGIEKTEYALTLMAEMEDRLSIQWNYQTQYVDIDQLKSLSQYLILVLTKIVNSHLDTEETIRLLPSLCEEESDKVLIEWNATEREYPRDKTVVELFEEQVFKNPNNVAVVYGEESLTYKELNERSNQMAHYLRCLGVRAETLVGVSLDRSLELIIGILGILKAGGAYVPLDPEYPEERLQFMLEDTAAPVLITSIHLKGKYTSYKGSFVIIDDEKTEEELGQESKENLEKIINGDNLVYVIYTSGSTGQPKGVMNSHNGFMNRMYWTLDHYETSNRDSLLYIASMSFDISVWEVLHPLAAGAKLVIIKNHKDMDDIINTIEFNRISMVHFVPSLLSLFLETKGISRLKSLRCVITGGEKLYTEVRKKFKEIFSDTRLYLAYGPTEVSISVTHWECNNNEYKDITPIGCPISNTKIYILDENRCLVPVGAVGEIYIGGIGLARGYLNRPELTAERFIGNPFANEEDITKGENLRLYRTGDLGRYLSDGNIEFRGRIDDQVKIRGYRIELGEIESALNGCGVVQGSVVVARSMGVGADNRVGSDKRLIGYIVPSSTLRGKLVTQESFKSSTGEEIGILGGEGYIDIVREVKEEIGKRLPEYMVPAHIVFIEKLPLTLNGKVDKKGLPDPDVEMGLVHQYMGPRDEVEAKLCKIWAEVLGLERVGIHDNFFEIGGHSLLATRVVSRIRSEYKGNLGLIDFFTSNRISLLAAFIKNNLLQSKKETKEEEYVF
ncbi:MAG: amino acid adenylation domain-containing protein [Candidatus Megaira endosymbiont of Mesostigma viride]|nr:MAG: amino acid adenylation domain-containing protein [Candidatus Megaira endosymbiont of Mesostigma viride]